MTVRATAGKRRLTFMRPCFVHPCHGVTLARVTGPGEIVLSRLYHFGHQPLQLDILNTG